MSIDEHLNDYVKNHNKPIKPSIDYTVLQIEETIHTVAELEAALWVIAKVRIVIRRRPYLPLSPIAIQALNGQLCMADTVAHWRDVFRKTFIQQKGVPIWQRLGASDVAFIKPDGTIARGQSRIKSVVWK